MTHTQAPWKVQQNSKSFDVMTADGRHCICSNFGCYATQEEKEANAQLIASAPELLEALEASLKLNELHFSIAEKFTPEFCDGNSPLEKAIKSAKEAIAKARGQ